MDKPDLTMVEEKRVTLVTPSPSTPSTMDTDEIDLEALGYKQELYRGFNGLMNFNFGFTTVGVISSLTGLFLDGLSTGGPVVLIWSWIIGSFLGCMVACVLAEMCSTYPQTGSVYYWAGRLAAPGYGPLCSYITGWFNFLGNSSGSAFYGFSVAAYISSLLQLAGYDELSVGAQVGITIGVYFMWAAHNFFRVDIQGHVNNFAGIYQILITLIVIITLGATCNSIGPGFATGGQVFTQWYNDTGFTNSGYVTLIGLLTVMYSVSGYEAAGHMSEETRQARKAAPRGIILTVVVSYILGFGYLLILLFGSAYDVDGIVNDDIGVSDVFNTCAGYSTGLALGILVLINIYFSGMSSMTTSSRIAYAMARDGAFPFSRYIHYVQPTTKAPLGGVILVLIFSILLALLNLINTTAFVAVTSIGVIGYQMSYAVPLFCRITSARNNFQQSTFNLGRWSVPFAFCSLIYMVVTSILFLFPTEYPVTAANLNYTPVVFGGVLIIGAAWWIFVARFSFEGPRGSYSEALKPIAA